MRVRRRIDIQYQEVVILAGAPAAWISRTQKCVTLSTTEAEYVAITDTLKEGTYVRNILSFVDLGWRSILLKEDNEGAIALGNNPVSSNNSKHIDVRYHFIRWKVQAGEVELIHVESAQQHADVLTKPLSRESLEVHLSLSF